MGEWVVHGMSILTLYNRGRSLRAESHYGLKLESGSPANWRWYGGSQGGAREIIQSLISTPAVQSWRRLLCTQLLQPLPLPWAGREAGMQTRDRGAHHLQQLTTNCKLSRQEGKQRLLEVLTLAHSTYPLPSCGSLYLPSAFKYLPSAFMWLTKP